MKVIVCENYDEMSAKAFEVMKELLDAKKDAVLGLSLIHISEPTRP